MNIHQPSLLDWQAPQAFRNTDPETSRLAADKAAKFASKGRVDVLRHLMTGAKTDFELADLIGRPQSSCGKRRGELRDRGYVEVALDGRGEEARRPSPSGSPALVWAITTEGRAFYAQETRGES